MKNYLNCFEIVVNLGTTLTEYCLETPFAEKWLLALRTKVIKKNLSLPVESNLNFLMKKFVYPVENGKMCLKTYLFHQKLVY